MNYYLDTSKNS